MGGLFNYVDVFCVLSCKAKEGETVIVRIDKVSVEAVVAWKGIHSIADFILS